MSDANDLLDLRREIADARECVERAGKLAVQLYSETCDRDRPGDEGWKDMGLLVDRLAALANSFAGLVPESVEKAVKSAEEYLDDMSDRADAASY